MRPHDDPFGIFGILAKQWHPQPEGKDAQPIWNGRKISKAEKEMEQNPGFIDVETRHAE